MATFGDGEIYKDLGVRPFINAMNQSTFVGGRPAQPAVLEAVTLAGTPC